MPETILITGLTGRTGHYLIERMEREREKLTGCRLVAIVRETSDTSRIDNAHIPIEKIVGDITDEAFLDTVMPNVATVLHIAGIHWSKPVVRAAVRAGVHRIIAVHTTGIYSKYKAAGEEYREIDAYCEKLCKDGGAALTILRPTMIYGGLDDGNFVRFIKLCDRFSPIPVVSGGRFLLQPVHRKDLGSAYFDVLINPDKTDGKQYVLSGERPVELREILAEMSRRLGREPKFISVPYFLAIAGAWVLFCLSIGRVDLREKVQRLVEDRSYPHDAAAADFGYSPMPLSEGICAETEEYMAAKAR